MAGVADVVATRVMDGEPLEVEAASFDAVITRVGLIYFPDRRVPHGHPRGAPPRWAVSAVTYSTPETNEFFTIPVTVIRGGRQRTRRHLASRIRSASGAPGRCARHSRQRVSSTSTCSGSGAPLHLPTALECVLFERESFGALHQMLAGLDHEARGDVGRIAEDCRGSTVRTGSSPRASCWSSAL